MWKPWNITAEAFPEVASTALGKLTDTTAQVILAVLSALFLIGLSVLIGSVLNRVMREKGFASLSALQPVLSGVVGLCLYLRFGISVTLLQGLFLFFVLLYASMSDLTTHTVDDCVWVAVLALGLLSIPTLGLPAMLLGAMLVFIPQLALALIPPHQTLGGADIKLSTALAFLLSGWKSVVAYTLGLLLAVVVVSIYHRKQKSAAKQPFALVPFLSIGAMILFFV